MSLHRQLAEAFGGRPRRVRRQASTDLTTLGNQRRETEAELAAAAGFEWTRVDFALVINPAGELADVERPPWRPRGKRSGSAMLVPQRQLRTPGGFSGFLWGAGAHALGLGGDLASVRPDPEAFNRFRIFHRAVLGNTRDPSLRAFLAFINHWRPERALTVPDLAPLSAGAVTFRFQYDGQFLHETHAARVIWRRLLASDHVLEEPDEAA